MKHPVTYWCGNVQKKRYFDTAQEAYWFAMERGSSFICPPCPDPQSCADTELMKFIAGLLAALGGLLLVYVLGCVLAP